MAEQCVALLMVNERQIAMLAHDHVAASRAVQMRREAPPIEQQDDLPAGFESRVDGAFQRGRDGAERAFGRRFMPLYLQYRAR